MGMLAEFKEFAVKGNVVDMAVGIIIGSAFGKIVSSLVKDVIMPPIGVMMGGVNFSKLAITLKPAAVGPDGKAIEAVLLNWGLFVQTIIDFLIVAFCIFLLVKAMNKFKRQEPAPEPEPEVTPPQEVLLAEIRDLLKKR